MSSSQNDPKILSDSLDISLSKVQDWGVGFYALLPNILASLVIIVLFVIFAWLTKRITTTYFNKRDRIDLGNLVSDISFWIIFGIGFFISLTVVTPTLSSGDLLSGFGLGSLAVGFVFKDILQNWFSGLLILIRLPFRRGDQVQIGDIEGTIQRIEPRATVIRTFDGKDVIIPNQTVYSSKIIVQTSQEKRRVELDITVGYDHDINTIRGIITTCLEPIDEILKAPEIQILCWDLGATSLGLKIRWWIHSERSNEVISRARAVQAIKEAFQANDIDPTDPDLIYTINSQSAAKPEAAVGKKQIHHPAPPPGFEMGTLDPETYTPKSDSKNQTLLPKDEPI